MGAILGTGFPQALVHTVHITRAFGTCACGKPIPKIAPMAKLDKLPAIKHRLTSSSINDAWNISNGLGKSQ